MKNVLCYLPSVRLILTLAPILMKLSILMLSLNQNAAQDKVIRVSCCYCCCNSLCSVVLCCSFVLVSYSVSSLSFFQMALVNIVVARCTCFSLHLIASSKHNCFGICPRISSSFFFNSFAIFLVYSLICNFHELKPIFFPTQTHIRFDFSMM